MLKPSLDDDAPVSLADLATMAGVSRPAVTNWRRRHDDFPSPLQESGTTTFFRFGDIKAWMAIHQKTLIGRSAEHAVWTALNSARGVVLPENAAEAGMAALGCAVVSAYCGDGVEDVLHTMIKSDSSSLRQFLSDLARLMESTGLPHLAGDHFAARPRWEDHASFFQEVARLALELGVADVFEALLAASARGFRGAGENTTPVSIARLFTALVPARGTILDFACGQGTLLLSAARATPAGEPLTLVGLDINDATRRLAQVRLLVHGFDADITTGDALHGTSQPRRSADLVLVDPPFGLSWRPNELATSDRLLFGVPPRSAADLAWVQLAIGTLRCGGQALIVTSMGALFRGGPEAEIRRRLVEAGCVRAVIALPPGLYPHTAIPVAVLILTHPEPRPAGDVVLVDASQSGTRQRGRTELSDAAIEQIVAAIRGGSVDRAVRACVVPLDALATGDSSLVPARWTTPGADPQELVERMTHGDRRVREAVRALAQAGPLPLTTTSHGAPIRSSSLLTMAESGLVTLIRPRRVDPTGIGPGDTPLVRPRDISADLLVTPREFVDQSFLSRPIKLTQPGDVLVVTDGQIRAGVDRDGGAVVSGPIHIVRPRSDLVSPEVLAALITHHGQQQAVGTTVPRINLKSLEIPLLDAESTLRLQTALRTINDHRKWAASALEALDDLAAALIVGVPTGSLRFVNHDETEQP